MLRTSIALLALAGALPAQSLWVDAVNGNNNNPGTAALPLKSITTATLLATPNTRVFVLAGTYSVATTGETFPLLLGSNANHDGVTIYGIGNVIVDLAGIQGSAVSIGLLANGGRITNLTFANMDKTDWWTRVITAGSFNGAGSSANFEIDRCTFLDVNRGMILWQGVPITGWKIHNNLFMNLGNDAINEFDTGSDNDIYNNTFFTSAHLGVLTDSDTTRVFNNVLTNLRVGIASSASSATTNARMLANDFWNNTRNVEGSAFTAGVPPGNLTVDPQFVNAPINLRLQPQSPLIEQGNPNVFARADLDMVSGSVDHDLDGISRPDIGAYETTPMLLSAILSGNTLSFNLTTSTAAIPVGLIVLSLDDGLIQLPGLSPILLDSATLIAPGIVGSLPVGSAFNVPALPPGPRIVMQGFGFEPTRPALVAGNQVRIQF